MSSAQAALLDQTVSHLACFEVKGQMYAIEVEALREVVRSQTITPLPNAPALIEGVIDLRGAVIPVLDLARVLGLGRTAESLQARIVVLAVGELILGLQVDAATHVLTVPETDLEEVPGLATQAGYDLVQHVLRREGAAPVMVLELAAVVARVESSTADAGEVTR